MKKFFSHPLVANLAILVSLIIAAFLVYHPSYLNPNLFWDDERFVFMSPEVLNAEHWYVFWDRSSQFFRSWPVGYAMFWSLVKYSPLQSVMFYKTLNIVFHALNTFLLYHVFKKAKLVQPLFLSLFFLVHPLQVEAVSWIFQLLLIVSFGFFTCSLWCVLDYLEKRKFSVLVLGMMFFILSLWTKSSALLAPFFFTYLFWVNNQKAKAYLLLIPFFLASFLIGLDNIGGTNTFFEKKQEARVVNNLQPSLKMQKDQSNFNAVYSRPVPQPFKEKYEFKRLEIFSQSVWHYFSKIILPVKLQFIYPANLSTFFLSLTICMLIFLFPLYLYIKKKNRYVFILPVAFFSFLVPYLGVSQISFFYWSNVSDRYCYYFLVVVPLIAALLLKNNSDRIMRYSLMVYLFTLISFNFLYAVKFNNPEKLYVEIIQYKQHPVIYKLLFDQYLQKSDPQKAEKFLYEGLNKFPNDPFLIDGKFQLDNLNKNFKY